MKSLLKKNATGLAAAAALAVSGPACVDQTPIDAPPPPTKARFVDVKTDITSIQGYVWDPEAFWHTVAMCGQDCPFPPLLIPGVPTIENAMVTGSQVVLFDPIAGKPTYQARALSNEQGGWYVEKVTARGDVPFLAVALPPDPATPALKETMPPFIPPVPQANYLPTVALKPIFTRFTKCLGQPTGVISDAGVLQAVAKYLTATGTPTTVPDLLDPAKFGGVLVTWMYLPGPPVLRVPAFATQFSAAEGRVLAIDWAPPDAPLPPEVKEFQSARGYMVKGEDQPSPIGLSVTLLAPISGPPSPIAVTTSDPVTDEASGRPWMFPPLPPLIIAPGIISFLELPGAIPGSPPPPDWVCF